MSSQTTPTTRRWRAAALALTAVFAGTLALAACQVAPPSSSTNTAGTADDGTTITMWTRSSTATFTQTLVNAYNASHKNKVKLTVFPADSYQQKVGTAAGARQLPDVLASDVVYAPNYAAKGVFMDITDRVNQLPFKADLAPAHMKAATYNGHDYAVPHDIDLSAMFYNKVLFTRAGLDPNKPPTTLTGMVADAKKIAALGGGVSGYFFGGACPGCQLFTSWPMIWASGGSVLNPQGTASTIDNPTAAQVYSLLRQMFADGTVPPSAKNESGTTWTQAFTNGQIGIEPMGATELQGMKEGPGLQVGVAPIPGLNGGSSSFVGGDVIGISSNSQHASEAWDFISWTLSEQAQVQVVAKNKNITVRSDLANNAYVKQDPRLAEFNLLAGHGETPISVNFGKTYNDPNGPWTGAVIDAVFGNSDVASSLKQHNGAITQSLSSND